MNSVTRLMLTSNGSGLKRSGLDGFVVSLLPTFLRFVWGPLPSPPDLATYLAARSQTHGPGEHWSDFTDWRGYPRRECRRLAFHEFCEPFDVIELWFDKEPNEQLSLIWLIHYLRSYPEIAAKLKLRLVDFDLVTMLLDGPDELEDVPLVDLMAAEIETACRCWEAFRAPTPEACFALLRSDLSTFPLLRPALADLLAELPCGTTGLGATEMRLLELMANGYSHTNHLFYLRNLGQRRVFNDCELGYLLQNLSFGPKPAIEGLDGELRTLGRVHAAGRVEAFRRSELSLTEFGWQVLAYKDDFSGHNPIDRWWGGTRLTNDNLWRWNSVLAKP